MNGTHFVLSVSTILCLLWAPLAVAQPTPARNGFVGGTTRSATVSRAAVPINGSWQAFDFGAADSQATSCGGCFGTNYSDAGDPPWTFNAGAAGVTLTVVDGYLTGDQFEVFDSGASLGRTSTPVIGGDCGENPDHCLADPDSSKRVFRLAPGPHSITIIAVAAPFFAQFGSGTAYFRVRSMSTAAAPIPTLGQWSQVILVLLMLGAIGWSRRRQQGRIKV